MLMLKYPLFTLAFVTLVECFLPGGKLVLPATPARWKEGFPLWAAPSADAVQLKDQLLRNVRELRSLQTRDGSLSVDFGVKGGEINATSRAPQKVDYYAVSTDVGKAADTVMATCDQITAYNPTSNATAYLGDKDNGLMAPLHGPWKLLFTTAADASFSKNSTRGDARAQNVVDAPKGRITNIIDFLPKEDGKDPVLKQLKVVIGAKASSANRVELNFRYAKAVLTRFFFLPVTWSLYIPVPATFITRCIVLFYRIFRRGQAKRPPQAYFDVVYLDDDLRIHKTGEDNLFVQARPTWEEAKELMK
jgi:hypothetical protein